MNHTDVINALKQLEDPYKAQNYARFFKTAPGSYGEGDIFLGITVPEQRKIAAKFLNLPLPEVELLLHSKIHEHRLVALIIMAHQFKKGSENDKEAIFASYLRNTAWINNWDLVDASADRIVGAHLQTKPREILYKLAASSHLWERRIAMIACFDFIKHGEYEDGFAIAQVLLRDNHDLIQKAVGWMLREIGKRCGHDLLVAWLLQNERYKSMPRTSLRYAIEHFHPDERQSFLKGYAQA